MHEPQAPAAATFKYQYRKRAVPTVTTSGKTLEEGNMSQANRGRTSNRTDRAKNLPPRLARTEYKNSGALACTRGETGTPGTRSRLAVSMNRAFNHGLALACTFAALEIPFAAQAEQVFPLGDGKVTVSGSVFAGVAVRSTDPNTYVLPNNNSQLVGIPGQSINPNVGRNADDGNLNYKKGDIVSAPVKTYVQAEYSQGNYGGVISAKAWYDYAMVNNSVDFGNYMNGYTPGEPLSDRGVLSRGQFSNIVLDNLFAYGHNEISDDSSVDWRLGNQKYEWGKRFYVLGGLRSLTPIDFPAVVRPGAVQEDETRIAVPALFASLKMTKATAIEGFYQFAFVPNTPNTCGTFFSAQDWVAQGCDFVAYGGQQGAASPLTSGANDRIAFKTGNYYHRAATPDTSNSGQFGLALKHSVESWATDFGLYATQFHSRANFYGGIKSLRPQNQIAYQFPNQPYLNPQYFTEYPEEIQMYGTTFETKWKGGSVFGELTYRPNQPMAYNAADFIQALTQNPSAAATSPLSSYVKGFAPGATIQGYERHKLVQFNLGAAQNVPSVLGAANLNLSGDVVYKGVPDLPDVNTTRFGRADVYGIAGFGNTPCNVQTVPPPSQANPGIQCSTNGYVSRNAWGYRLRGALRYADVGGSGVDLIPAVFFGQDVSGWAADNSILKGRSLAALTLTANYRKQLTAQVGWYPTWGGDYNNLKDRDIVQANVGYLF
jgi:hypothetical protein